MANLRPKRSARKPAQSESSSPREALEDLARALAKWSEQLGVKPPPYVLAALEQLDAAIDGEPAPVPESNQRRAVIDDGLALDNELASSKRRGRHDEKSLPAGYTYRDGYLIGPTMVFRQPERRTDSIGRSLLLTLACQYSLNNRQLSDYLLSSMGKLRPSSKLHERAAALEAAYEALFGEPYGTPRWVGWLIAQLEMDARHREAERQREVRGEQDPITANQFLSDEHRRDIVNGRHGALFRPAHGGEILDYLRESREPLPSELTAAAIEAMRSKVSINGRGRGGKKTAKNVVRSFVAALGRRSRK